MYWTPNPNAVLAALLACVIGVAMPWRAWRRWRYRRAAVSAGAYVVETSLLAAILLAVLRLAGVEWSSVGLHPVGIGPFILHTMIGVLVLIAPDLAGLVLRRIRRRRPDDAGIEPLEGRPSRRDVIAFIPVGLVSAFWEELCFRGTALYLAPDGFVGGVALVLVSSTIFGLHHLRQGPLAAGITGFFGVLLCLLYLATRDLPAMMAAHAISNGCVVLWLAPRARADMGSAAPSTNKISAATFR